MVDLNEWVKKEWGVIVKAPSAAFLCAVIGAVVGYTAASTIYSHEISGIAVDRDYWKGRAEPPISQATIPAPTPISENQSTSPHNSGQPEAAGSDLPPAPEKNHHKHKDSVKNKIALAQAPPAPTEGVSQPLISCPSGACSNNQSGGVTQYVNQAVPPTYEQVGDVSIDQNADGTFTKTLTIKIKSESLPINVGIGAIGPEVLGLNIVPLDMMAINTVYHDWTIPGGYANGLDQPSGRIEVQIKVQKASSNVNVQVMFNVQRK